MNQSANERYVIKLVYPIIEEGALHDAATRLAPALNLSVDRAKQILRRENLPLIKPTNQVQANTIAASFIQAGIPVDLVDLHAAPSSTAIVPSPVGIGMAARGNGAPDAFGSTQPLWGSAPAFPETTEQPLWGGGAAAPTNVAGQRSGLETIGAGSNAEVAPETEEHDESLAPARSSLRLKLLAAALVPVVFVGISALSLLALNLPRGFQEIDQQRTQQLIRALVSNVDSQDTKAVRDTFRRAIVDSDGDIGFMALASSSNEFVTRDDASESGIKSAFEQFRGSPEFLQPRPVWDASPVGGGRLAIYQASVYGGTGGALKVEFHDGLHKTGAKADKLFDVTVGVSNKQAQAVSNQKLTVMASLIGLVLVAAAFLATAFARSISRSIVQLTDAADAISLGDFEVAVKRRSNDELGDLAESLERMRLSLRSALDRLRKRR